MDRFVLIRWHSDDIGRIVRTVVSFLGAIAAIALAFAFIGVEDVTQVLADADRGIALLATGTTITVLLLRGTALWVVLGLLERPLALPRALVLYAAVTFVNTIAPAGQAGGTPIGGLLVSRSAASDYETGVAAVLSITVLNNLMIGVFGIVGTASVLVSAPQAQAPLSLAAVGIGTVVVTLSGIAVAWIYRTRVAALTAAAIWTLLRVADRVVPWTLPDRAAVEHRIQRFGEALAHLVDGPPKRVALLVSLVALAHGGSVFALWLAFAALGHAVSFGVLLMVIPSAVLAAIAPVPGGLGGVDIALIAVLVSATGVGTPFVGAAVLLYRAATYWLRIGIGGIATAAVLSFDEHSPTDGRR